jgi:Baseplate J-like protein
MPLTIPPLDTRTYQELVDDALARIPIHNPEWTNFTRSDPGVTLIELFAFMTESLLYRANQIPDRNRRVFLSLLGVPLKPAASARGLVAFANERGPLETVTLAPGLEVRAGNVPFRTEDGADVLPVEARAYVKRRLTAPPQELVNLYRHLYASFTGPKPQVTEFQLYETVPLYTQGPEEVDLARDTTDGALWLALLLRATDRPAGPELVEQARLAIAGKTLNLGVVPVVEGGEGRRLSPAPRPLEQAGRLDFQLPRPPPGGLLPTNVSERVAAYRTLDARVSGDPLLEPAVVQLTLPEADGLGLWTNLEPLEAGVGDFPPALEDSALETRVVTWLRVRASAAVGPRLLWLGVNAARVSQRAHVVGEALPDGTGEPDQVVRLARTPVIPESVRLTVGGEPWRRVDDLLAAGPEVPVADPRDPPGARPAPAAPADVFVVDAEAGEVRFGDGLRGRRPPPRAALRADYDYGAGREGNVGPGAIGAAPALPAGMTVANPVRTWGGAEAETVAEGERHAARFLQHRDRLVSAADFEVVTRRTPGVDVGRVEVLPAFDPLLAQPEPGDAPGAVTVLVLPRHDPVQPDAPMPDRAFLDAVCRYLDPRRLVTTEVFVRGPVYRAIWVSVGIDVVPGAGVALVREDVVRALRRFLSPLPSDEPAEFPHAAAGWPLRKPVIALELLAVVARVGGVRLVPGLLLAEGSGPPVDALTLSGLDLPRLVGISVVVGDPLPLDELRGAGPAAPGPPVAVVPVPVVPQEC